MRRAMLVAAASLAALVLACADFEAPKMTPPPDVLVATPSLANDLQPVFTARCATVSCHNFATHQVGLILAEGYTYDRTVNVQSRFRPAWKRIVPFKPDSSFLVQVLSSDTTKHPEISRMPLGRPPLTANQIQNIITWINQGAQRN